MNKFVWNNINTKKSFFWYSNFKTIMKEKFFTYQYGASIAKLVNIKEKEKVGYCCGTAVIIDHSIITTNNVDCMDFVPKTVNAVNDRYINNSSFLSCFTYDQILDYFLTHDHICN